MDGTYAGKKIFFREVKAAITPHKQWLKAVNCKKMWVCKKLDSICGKS